MKCRVVLCVAASMLLWQAAGVHAELPPLIPRTVLFGNPDKAKPQISPDGKRLAYLAPDEGVLNVWVRTVGQTDDRAVTKDRNRGVNSYFWAQNNRQILYSQDKVGDGAWHFYAVDLDKGDIRDLTPFEGVQARVIAVEQGFPNEILVGINNRDPKFHDVYRVDLTTGTLALEAQNDEGLLDWHADHDLRIRAAMKPTAAGGFELVVRDDTDAAWRTLTAWEPQDALYCGPISFTPDAKGLYIASSTGSDTAELREIDLTTGKEKTLASDRHADIARVYVHPIEHTIQAVGFNKERIHWKVLDPSVKDDFRAIKRIRRGDFGINNRDHADKTWLIYFNADDGPVSYYAYDRESKKAEFLFTNREALKGVKLAKMAPISFKRTTA